MAVRAIERVEEAVLVVVEERFHEAAITELDIGEHRRAHRVVVPAVPRRVLEAPVDGAAIDVDGDRRGGPFVVALAHVAVPRCGVARVPIDEVQRRVVDTRRPGRSASILPCVAGPCFVARFAWAGDGIGRPPRLAALCVESFDEAADAELAAGDAREDHVLHHERRSRDAVALPPVDDGRLPNDVAALLVERDHAGIHRADEDELAPEGDAAIDRATAIDALGLVRELGVVAP